MITFQDFDLNEHIVAAIDELNFKVPTPIQAKAIPFLLYMKEDLMGLAQTGTGKTAAFGLPILQQINTKAKHTQAIILSPTRELGVQIAKDMENFAKYIPNLTIAAVYGGASIEKQIALLNKGAHVIVGTPGRVIDLMKRKELKIDNIEFVVLDEADEMLQMGFKEDLDIILEKTPKEKRTLLFSATMSKEIRKIADTYMRNPHEIAIGPQNAGAENVEHYYHLVAAKNRYLALKRIADMHPSIYGIVFCRTRKETQEVADKLIQDGYNADSLHGDLSQAQRDSVMRKFRTKHLQMLVATDVAARGLDVNDLTHIINYNLPDESEIYIHRSGRTGRAGKNGVCISIVYPRDVKRIQDIEKIIQKSIAKKPVPGGEEICRKQLMNMVAKVEKIETIDQQIDEFLPEIHKKLSWLTREELIKRFVSVEFNRFLNYYKEAPDLNIPEEKKREKREKKGKKGAKDKTSYSIVYLTLGTKDGFTKTKLIDMVNSNEALSGAAIGRIELLKTYTAFELESSVEKEIPKAFKNAKYEGKKFEIEVEKVTSNKRSKKGR